MGQFLELLVNYDEIVSEFQITVVKYKYYSTSLTYVDLILVKLYPIKADTDYNSSLQSKPMGTSGMTLLLLFYYSFFT